MKYIFSLGIFSIVFLVTGCGDGSHDTEETPRSVSTAPVVRTPCARPVRTSGRLSSPAEIQLSFTAGGIIDEIRAEEGSRVRSGDILAALRMDEIDARLSMARSGFEKARRDLQRVRNLHADTVATLEQLQDAETALDAAEARLNIAEFSRRHSVIRAPSDGVILRRLAEEEEMAAPGRPVLVLGSRKGLWRAETGVTGRDMVRLSPGDSARVKFAAFPGQPFSGSVQAIGGAPDPAGGTWEVELSLAEASPRFADGLICTAVIYPSRAPLRAVIPFEALVDARGDSAAVFTVSGGRAQRRGVVIDYLTDETAVIAGGLEGVDRVVTRGAAFLRDGSSVSVADTSEWEDR